MPTRVSRFSGKKKKKKNNGTSAVAESSKGRGFEGVVGYCAIVDSVLLLVDYELSAPAGS